MNREIKFRGKLFEADEWVYGGGVQLINGFGCMISIDDSNQLIVHKVDPETVGQFTGFKDSNGTDIYEGDVIYFRLVFWRVEWNNELGRWMGVYDRGQSHRDIIGDEFADTEVTGNIHDNKE